MSHEIKNQAVELSADELDCVAGGLVIDLGGVQGIEFGSDASFQEKQTLFAQETVAGPNGAGTKTAVAQKDVFSNAGQDLLTFN